MDTKADRYEGIDGLKAYAIIGIALMHVLANGEYVGVSETARKEEKYIAYGQYTKELWIDRRENSKSLAWSSVLLALNNIKEVGAVVDRPKALGDIRGVTYIYGMFYRFGLIDMPDKVNGKMKRAGRQM